MPDLEQKKVEEFVLPDIKTYFKCTGIGGWRAGSAVKGTGSSWASCSTPSAHIANNHL